MIFNGAVHILELVVDLTGLCALKTCLKRVAKAHRSGRPVLT